MGLQLSASFHRQIVLLAMVLVCTLACLPQEKNCFMYKVVLFLVCHNEFVEDY